MAPALATYEPRDPSRTVLYRVIADHLETFLADYDIGQAESFKGIAEGVENTNYVLSTTRGQYMVTLYEKRVDPRDLFDHDAGGHRVRTLAAVLLRIGEPEEAELAHAAEDGVGERRLLPLLRVRRELLDHVRVDRLAELVVVIVEDEVLAARPVVGLQHVGLGGGHI